MEQAAANVSAKRLRSTGSCRELPVNKYLTDTLRIPDIHETKIT